MSTAKRCIVSDSGGVTVYEPVFMYKIFKKIWLVKKISKKVVSKHRQPLKFKMLD